MIDTLHASIVALMQASGSGAGKIVWGTATTPGSPYYKEAPEPQPKFPFIVFDVEPSNTEDQYEEAYVENYNVEVKVYVSSTTGLALPPALGLLTSPYQIPKNSVIAYLDGFNNSANMIPADTFQIFDWNRESYEVRKEESRDPSGGRLWIGVGKYSCRVSAVHI
jgi:hypothetical protein